ncbi:MAG: hypothetical protein ACRDYF_17155, partial [Acidimicrobiia bacterium]
IVGEEKLRAEGARLLVDAVGELTGEDIDRLLRGLPPPLSTEVVSGLIGNKLDPRRLKNLGTLLVNSLQKRPPARQALLVERLSTGILATFETELGERFENPSLGDLREVLDAVLAEHPAAGVRCTLSWVVEEGMPAAEAARDVLLTEPRLTLPGWAEAS